MCFPVNFAKFLRTPAFYRTYLGDCFFILGSGCLHEKYVSNYAPCFLLSMQDIVQRVIVTFVQAPNFCLR